MSNNISAPVSGDVEGAEMVVPQWEIDKVEKHIAVTMRAMETMR